MAEVVAMVVVWIPAMCSLGFCGGESNSGLIHAVLNVFALWVDAYYHRGYLMPILWALEEYLSSARWQVERMRSFQEGRV